MRKKQRRGRRTRRKGEEEEKVEGRRQLEMLQTARPLRTTHGRPRNQTLRSVDHISFSSKPFWINSAESMSVCYIQAIITHPHVVH